MKRDSFPFVVFSLAVFFLLTFSSFVLAAEPINATKEPVVVYNPYYIGIFGGFVVPDELKVENGETIKLNNSWTAGAKAGYIFPFRWLATELEYAYLDNQNVDEPGTGHFKTNNLMANLILRYPKSIDKLGMISRFIPANPCHPKAFKV